MNSESTAPADHLQRSAAQQNGLWNPPPTATLGRARGESGRLDRPCRLAARARRNQAVHGVISAAPPVKRHALAQTAGARLGRRYRASTFELLGQVTALRGAASVIRSGSQITDGRDTVSFV
jgi:hypothetical protein